MTDDTRSLMRNVGRWSIASLLALCLWLAKGIVDDNRQLQIKQAAQEQKMAAMADQLFEIKSMLVRIENRLWRE